MATITGVTLQKMEEIKNNTIISARVENGILYFKRGDNATEFNVGTIVLPAISAWPVGSIFMSTDPTNPKTLLGVPSDSPVTWVRWGQGRMPVSLNEANARFDSVEETGGVETVQLTTAEMPAHSHGGNTGNQSNDHAHSGYTRPAGEHTHGYVAQAAAPQTAAGSNNYYTGRYGAQTDSAGSHSHLVQTYGADSNHTHAIASEGGGGFHENMPPYITVYMWKRTV